MAEWKETNERFVNPYNFVPFEEKCKRELVPASPGKLTGYLECGLDILSPLFIPNTSNKKALQQKYDDVQSSSYNFFSYTDLKDGQHNPSDYYEPVIPGSEIRGTIRSVFEAAFNGCMSVIEEDRILRRRTTVPKKPGRLYKQGEEWFIQPCERWMLNRKYPGQEPKHGKFVADSIYDNWIEGEELYVKKSREVYKTSRGFSTEFYVVKDYCTTQQSGGWVKGYLHKGETFGSKHHESVFVCKPKVLSFPVSINDVKKLRQVLDEYNDPAINRHIKEKGTWYREMEVNEQGTLIYYSDKSQNEKMPFYMTPAILSKEIYTKHISGLLKQNGEYQPCNDNEHKGEVCPACALFGKVDVTGGQSRGSRIRFEDAQIAESLSNVRDYYSDDVVLPELGEPKPGAVEFYTYAPELKKGIDQKGKPIKVYKPWTYDYKIVNKKRELLSDNLPKLRGRKFYWHSPEDTRLRGSGKDVLTPMKQRVRPLKPLNSKIGPLFAFRIYFEGVTELELQRLQWALTFNNPACAHKMGRGKSLGMGSVRIYVQNVFVRTINQQTGLWELSLKKVGYPQDEGKSAATIKKLMEWDWKYKDVVAYPKGEGRAENKANKSASHQWFKGNRANQNQFTKVLPTVEEEWRDSETWLYKLNEEIPDYRSKDEYNKSKGKQK